MPSVYRSVKVPEPVLPDIIIMPNENIRIDSLTESELRSLGLQVVENWLARRRAIIDFENAEKWYYGFTMPFRRRYKNNDLNKGQIRDAY